MEGLYLEHEDYNKVVFSMVRGKGDCSISSRFCNIHLYKQTIEKYTRDIGQKYQHSKGKLLKLKTLYPHLYYFTGKPVHTTYHSTAN